MTTSTYNKFAAFLGLAVGLTGYASLASAEATGFIKLKDVQGKVMVNTGSGFVAGNSGMVLKPGYKIMLSDKSLAKINFAGNCTQTLKSNSLIKVGVASECKSNMFDEQSFTKTAAIGDIPLEQAPGVSTSILVWSATLGALVLQSNSSNSSNQSPNASAL